MFLVFILVFPLLFKVEWWQEEVEEGTASFMFSQRLKLLKEQIVTWKREEFGKIEARKVFSLGKIENLEKKEMLNELEEAEKANKMMTKHEYHQILRMKKNSWRQKSRVS